MQPNGLVKILIWIGLLLLTGIRSLGQSNTLCRDSNMVQRYRASQTFERSRNIPLQDGGSLTWGGELDNYSSFNYTSIFRTDASGQVLWSTQLLPEASANFPQVNMIENSNGQLLVSGLAKFGSDNKPQYIFVACLDPSGALLWYHFYEASINLLQTEYPVSISTAATDAVGNFFVAVNYGETTPFNYLAAVVCKINNTGNLVWNKAFISTTAARFLGVFVQNDTLSLFSSTGSITPFVNMQLNTANATITNLKAYRPAGHLVWPGAEVAHKVNGNRYVLNGGHKSGNGDLSGIDFNTLIFDQRLQPVTSFHVKTFPVNYATGWGGINKNMTPGPGGELMYGIARNAESSFYYGLVDANYQVTIQKRLQNANGNFVLPPLRYYKDGRIFIHSNGCNVLCGLDYLSFDKDIVQTNNCFSAHDTSFMTLLPFNLELVPFNWDQEEDNVLQPVTTGITQQATVFTMEEVCKEINQCERPVITGPDSICLSTTETLFTVHKNIQCFKAINWTFDTSAVQSTRIVNDTTIGIVFKTNWQGFIIADIKGSCDFLSDSQYVVVYDLQQTSILGNDTSLCTGDTITLRAGGSFSNYTWQNNSSANRFIAHTPGTYWVTVTDARGCSGSDTVVISDMHLSQFLPADTTICLPQNFVLQPTASYQSYLWSNGATTPSITVTGAGQYWLTVTNGNGCTGIDSITVSAMTCQKRVFFPNAFSPDGNKINDVFKPVIVGKPSYYELVIYNRWGQLIFRTNNPLNGWNGQWKGKLQRGTHVVWVCSYQFEHEARVTEKGGLTVL